MSNDKMSKREKKKENTLTGIEMCGWKEDSMTPI